MVRLTAPNGATVDVSDEKATRLIDQGYKPVDEKPKRRARKTDSDDE